MIRIGDREYGTAAEVAAQLTSRSRPITADRVRDWARRARRRRDRLYGKLRAVHLSGPRTGTTVYDLDEAAQVELLTRPARSLDTARTVAGC